MSVSGVKSQQMVTLGASLDNGGGKPGGSTLTIEKVLKLFTSKHTAALYDRQSSAVARLCRHTTSAGGFFISDLERICAVVDLCVDRLKNGQDSFRDCLCSMLELLGTEFRRTRANEEFTNNGAITSVIKKLGELLFFPDPSVQIVSSQSLLSISKGCLDGEREDKAREKNVDDMRPTNRDYYQGIIRNEGVLAIAVDALLLEVQELLSYDANNDGIIDETEMEQFKADNDDIQGNEDADVRAAMKKETGGDVDRPKSSGEEQRSQDECDASSEKPPPYFLLSLIRLICQCSYDDQNASLIIQSEALKALVDVLATVVDFREEVLAIVLEILWNVLEKSLDVVESMKHANYVPQKREELLHRFRTANAMFVLGRSETFATLQNLLRRLFEGGFKRKDKELRNETLICLHILAERKNNLVFFRDTGIVDMVLAYSTGMEAPQIDGGESVWASKYLETYKAPIRNYATTSHEDLECKLLMLDLINKVCTRDEGSLDVVVQSPLFFPVLFAYLGPNATNLAGFTPWQSTQVKMIQQQVFTVLQELCPRAPHFFSQLKGNDVVLAYLSDPQNSWELRGMALDLLCVISRLDGQAEDLGELGCVEMMVDLCHGSLQPKILVNACILLTNICGGDGQEDNKNQVRLRKGGGVEVLRERIRWSPEDSLAAKDQVIAIIGAVWSCVVGNRRSEARFLKLEGVDALLDMVEVCPTLMRPQIVGALSDLLQNPKSVPYFKEWKSDISMKTASQLFLEMWALEEDRLGLSRPRETGGIISNLIYPLRSHAGDTTPCPPESSELEKTNDPASPIAHSRLKEALAAAKDFEAGKAVDAETETLTVVVNNSDLRPKLYAVLASVGFQDIGDYLETTQTMVASIHCEQYPTFRVGEIYADIREELAIEKVKAISADSLWVEGQLEEVFNIASAVKCRQGNVKKCADVDTQGGEASFFNNIRQKAEQEFQAHLSVKKSRMPKSSMKARLEAKAKKAEMLKKSLQH